MKKRITPSMKKAYDYSSSGWKKKRATLLHLFSEYNTDKNIAKWLNISLGNVKNLKSRYRKTGLINKDNSLTTKGKKAYDSSCDGINSVLLSSLPDDTRLHNIRFKIKILAKPKNWNKDRHKYLEEKRVRPITTTFGFYTSEKLIIDNTETICNKDYIIFIIPDIVTREPSDASYLAIQELRKTAQKFQLKTGIKLMERDRFEFQIVSNHYALIKNQLAKQYNKENKKLFVFNEKNECIYLVDNSLYLNEFEAIHRETGEQNATSARDYFQAIGTKPHYTPDIAKNKIDRLEDATTKFFESINEYNQSIKLYDINVIKHLDILDDMKETLKAIRESLKK